jgi:hypothetical protein
MEWAFRQKVWAGLRKSVGGLDRQPSSASNHGLGDFPDHPTNGRSGKFLVSVYESPSFGADFLRFRLKPPDPTVLGDALLGFGTAGSTQAPQY